MDLALLLSELTRDEGVSLKPYRDSVDKLTIGIGRNLDDVGISREEAEQLLGNDVARSCRALDDFLPFWRNLGPVRQRVMANMAFNMGIRRLLTFKFTMLMIEQGEYARAASAMLDSLWARQVGVRAQRLAEMMRTGIEPTTKGKT
jgi:lysozyme